MEVIKEFFQLISNKFTLEQIQKFDNFYLNLENDLELDYTREVFNIEIKQEKQWNVAYMACYDKI